MRPAFTSILSLAALLLVPRPSLHAEDWTLPTGKVYQNVTVVKAEPDAVTILDKEGGAFIPLAQLPPDLQKRFNYDPAKAQAAADARAKADAQNQQALQAEAVQANKIKQAQLAADLAAQKAILAKRAANAHHDGLPPEPDVLEARKHLNDDPLNKPKP